MKKRLDHIWQTFLKENKCPYGCDLTSIPCEHLEDYIEDADVRSHNPARVLLVPDIDDVHTPHLEPSSDTEGYYLPESSEKSVERLVKKLEGFGLTDIETDVVIDRCLENLTFSEIAEKHGYTSAGMAYRHYKIVVEKLRRGGFGKTDE